MYLKDGIQKKLLLLTLKLKKIDTGTTATICVFAKWKEGCDADTVVEVLRSGVDNVKVYYEISEATISNISSALAYGWWFGAGGRGASPNRKKYMENSNSLC